ncbi:hypothetical protein [Tianweitania sediminis]|uniref:Uncharacterized protein n=1 Tax=Tianweitania sediminis TaxID=1502156 RepID=A0A8J7UJ85_9HYPH|nr:hypothetical protein [Tianweitania sediminis]MBP0438419.1 hypothetical protein [Tianweitania sediminis]
MEGWLKALIAAACVAVLASAGYFFWNERKSALAGKESADCETLIRVVLKERPERGTPMFNAASSCLSDGRITQDRFDELVRQTR